MKRPYIQYDTEEEKEYDRLHESVNPHYLRTGRKNPSRYNFAGFFNTGDVWVERADNKDEVEYVYLKIMTNEAITRFILANELGQPMFDSKSGWNEHIIHPKYMDKIFERWG